MRKENNGVFGAFFFRECNFTGNKNVLQDLRFLLFFVTSMVEVILAASFCNTNARYLNEIKKNY